MNKVQMFITEMRELEILTYGRLYYFYRNISCELKIKYICFNEVNQSFYKQLNTLKMIKLRY